MDGLSNPWDLAEQRKIEGVLAGNLPPEARAVDFYSGHDGGTGISIKALDTRGTSYRAEPSSIGSTGMRYVNELHDYLRGVEQPNPPYAFVLPEDVSVWVLRFAYPASATEDPAVVRQLDRILKRGRETGIVVQLVPIDG